MQAHPRSLAESLRDHFHRQGLRGTMEDYNLRPAYGRRIHSNLGYESPGIYRYVNEFDMTSRVNYLNNLFNLQIYEILGYFGEDSPTKPPFSVHHGQAIDDGPLA